MTDTLRLLLLLVLAGAAVTFAASGVAWWMDEQRRLARLLGRVLGGEPDGLLIAPGRNSGVGFRLEAGQIAVMRSGGARTMIYPFNALEGAELLVDEAVAARVWRGEPRKALDAVNPAARHVTLRLVFDNAREPEFLLDLWLPADAQRRDDQGPAGAITEGRAWLARAEALIRRPVSRPVVQAAPAWDADDQGPDFDDQP